MLLKSSYTTSEEKKPRSFSEFIKKLTSQLCSWPTSSPCCLIKDRCQNREALHLLCNPTPLHINLFLTKNCSGVQAISAGDITQPQFRKQRRYTFFFLMWFYHEIITERNYVSTDMEYSSKPLQEDPLADE